MTEQELLNIQKFLDNPDMVEAVKKVLLAEGLWNLNLTKSNVDLGADVRAKMEGQALLEHNFKELLKLKRIKENTADKVNPAR